MMTTTMVLMPMNMPRASQLLQVYADWHNVGLTTVQVELFEVVTVIGHTHMPLMHMKV